LSNIVTRSRLEDQLCVNCGFELIDPKNADLGMCTACIRKSKTAAMKQIKERKSRTGAVRRLRLRVDPKLVRVK